MDSELQIEALRQQFNEAAQKMVSSERAVNAAHQRLLERDHEIEQSRQLLEGAASNPGISGHAVEEAIEQLRNNLEERGKDFSHLHQLVINTSVGGEQIHNLVKEFSTSLSVRDSDIEFLDRLMVSVDQGLDASEPIGAELRRELEERERDLEAMRSRLAKADRRQKEYEEVIKELSGEEEEREKELTSISNLLDQSQQQTAAPDHRERDLEAFEQWLQEESDHRRAAEEEARKLQEQIEGKDHLIRDLTAKTSQLHVALMAAPAAVPSVWQDESPRIANVYEAVESADQHFDRLRFLPSAYKSAETYPFQRPQEVYGAFSLLQQLAVARSQGSLGIRVEDWMQEQGCDYSAHESEATMNKHGNARLFDGVEMQEHIKIGGGTANTQHYIRIHFAWGEGEQKFIVGHVGVHLPIATA